MRRLRAATWLAAALGAACSDSVPRLTTGAAGSWTGPDAVLVRLPSGGGVARAYRWGQDSVLWTSSQPVPRLDQLVAFDADEGTVTVTDARGVPTRVELRLGSVTPSAPTAMEGLVSVDGWAVYGITPRRELLRMTPGGNWTYRSALTPRTLLPQPDGSLVLLNDLGERSTLRRMHPPEARVVDTASVPRAAFAVNTAIGDRIYFGTDSGLAAVRVRDLGRARTVALPAPPRDAAPTPSGDRIFVALFGRAALAVIDKYEERVVGTVPLEGYPDALRMDPDGRYLLARLEHQDSVAVVSVAESRVVQVMATGWRNDLPLVGPDGNLLLLRGDDVVDINPLTGGIRRRYAGGATDLWALIRWNGFRPRAKGLDTPVSFDADSLDSLVVASDSGAAPPAAATRPGPGAPPPPVRAPTRNEEPADARRSSSGWTLSFAALLDEQRARTLAGTIRVEGKPVRVVQSERDGATIWRIVYGPFPTRQDAERAGRRTGLPYWVYEESP